VRVDLDEIAPGILAIDRLEVLALEQRPDLGIVLAAHIRDALRQHLDVV